MDIVTNYLHSISQIYPYRIKIGHLQLYPHFFKGMSRFRIGICVHMVKLELLDVC